MPANVPTSDEYDARVHALETSIANTTSAVVDLSGRVSRLVAQLAATDGNVAALTARVTALEAAPPPPTHDLMVGITPEPNTGTGILTTESRAGGLFDMRRIFTKTVPTSFAATAGADIGRRATCLSFKADWAATTAGVNDSSIRGFLAGVPTDHELWLAYHHEPEDNGPASAFIPAQQRVKSLVDAANVGRAVPIRFGGILMAFDPERGATYVPDKCWDWLGYDGYSWPDQPVRSAADIFTACFDKARALGFTSINVPEFGNGHGETDRSAWITDTVAWFRSQGVDFACYFDKYANVLTDNELHALVTA